MTEQQTQLIPIDIKSVDEPWTIINLVDGTIIRTKMVIVSCHAIYDMTGNQVKLPDGQLAYAIAHAMVNNVISSPTLLAQPTGTKQ